MKSGSTRHATCLRWIKFNAVGGIGILLQLALLALLTQVLRLRYLPATVTAVELTVLHNFTWHERYTWKDETLALNAPSETSAQGKYRGLGQRLMRFHVGNGLVSIVGNLVLMKIFAGELHLGVLVSNMVAITTCSLANFCLADRWIFTRGDYS